jgi:hypothetical protein
VHARHAEVEQDQVGLARQRQPVGQLVERAGLQDLGIRERRAERLAQRPAKQGMVIDDDEPVVRHAPPASEARVGAGQPGPTATDLQPDGNLAAFCPIG